MKSHEITWNHMKQPFLTGNIPLEIRSIEQCTSVLGHKSLLIGHSKSLRRATPLGNSHTCSCQPKKERTGRFPKWPKSMGVDPKVFQVNALHSTLLVRCLPQVAVVAVSTVYPLPPTSYNINTPKFCTMFPVDATNKTFILTAPATGASRNQHLNHRIGWWENFNRKAPSIWW